MSRDYPKVLRIEPASACNLRCSHCPTGTSLMPRGLMSEQTFERILDDLALNVERVQTVVLYHGGEPFLNKNFLQMVRRVKATGVRNVKTVTNGMLLKNFNIGDVLTCGLNEIEFSLDGASPDENDTIRRRSKHQKILEGVKVLLNAKVEKRSGLKVSISSVQFVDPGVDVNSPPRMPDWILDELSSFSGVVNFKPTWALVWPSGLPKEGYGVVEGNAPSQLPKSCNLVDETMTIRADGSVVACCFDLTSLSNFGNVNLKKVGEIWLGHKRDEFRQRFKLNDYDDLCAECALVCGPRYLTLDTSIKSTAYDYFSVEGE